MRTPAFLLAVLLAVHVVAAYPDAGQAPRYFDSPCIAENNRRFVHDFTGIMDAPQAVLVEERACGLYRNTTAHLVLALVASTEGESIDAYATHLFEQWGIGQKSNDDGLLILYAADDGSGAGAVRIEVGYGLEGTINSIVARQAVDSMAAVKQQALQNGSTEPAATSQALAAGTLGLVAFLQDNYTDGHFASADSSEEIPWGLIALGVAVTCALLLNAFLRGGLGGSGGGLGGRRGGDWGSGGWNGGWGGGQGGRRGGGGFGGGRSGGGGWGGRLGTPSRTEAHHRAAWPRESCGLPWAPSPPCS